VLLGFAALGFLTTQLPSSGVRFHSATDTYQVTARFDNVGDLKVGAPVTMAGVRIGQRDRREFRSERFQGRRDPCNREALQPDTG